MTDRSTVEQRMRSRVERAIQTVQRHGHTLGPYQRPAERELCLTAVCRKCGADFIIEYIIGGPGSTGDIFFISGSAFNEPCVVNPLKF